MIGEAFIIAAIVYLGLFHKPGPLYLQCNTVDRNTRVETHYGYIKLIRKNGSLAASLLEWGPDRVNKTNLVYAAMGSLSKPDGVAIFDEQPSFDGHTWILTRHKGWRFSLSEEVADRTRLDYCVRVKQKDFPQHLLNVHAPLPNARD